jgi:hypothetical protein
VAPAGLGLATIVQLVPFHRSTKAVSVEPDWDEPTAKQLVALTQETPPKPAADPAGFGLGTIDQAVPFHRSTTVRNGWFPAVLPTAKQLVALSQSTAPKSVDVSPSGLGLGSIDQPVPFHRCTNDLFVPLVS